jgi:glycosyltransferase involved in cell wall biosynthesis
MKKQNIAFFLISDGWAGAENAVYNILKNVNKKNHDFHLIVNNDIKKHYKNLKNIKIHDLGDFYNKGKLGKIIFIKKIRRQVFKILTEEKINNLVIFLETSIMIYFKMYNKITSVSIALRGSEIKRYFNKKKSFMDFVNKICLGDAIKQSSKILSVSLWQIEPLNGKYKKKTVVIPNGVDTKIFKPLKNIKQKKNVILFTGRFIELKGIREILRVAKQLPQYEFWFAGQGPLDNNIRGENVKNLGFKNTNELVRLYNQSTICILPSYREGFSNVGLEVTSCGRALICTPLGFSEYIENGKDGIIISAKDSEALKNAVVDLMENPVKRKNIEKNALKKALGYSWDKVAKQYLKVFEEVSNNSTQKPLNNSLP